MRATPRPWCRTNPDLVTGNISIVSHYRGEGSFTFIADVVPKRLLDEQSHNAALIIQAVNAHDALLAACTAAVALLDDMQGHWPGTMSIDVDKVRAKLDDAALLAVGEV